MEFQRKDHYNIDDLLEIMKILRSPEGCPWDREQTHESIRQNFIEETYEAIEAIDTKDTELLKEELGDVLMQVVFHALMEEEAGKFDFSDAVSYTHLGSLSEGAFKGYRRGYYRWDR